MRFANLLCICHCEATLHVTAGICCYIFLFIFCFLFCHHHQSTGASCNLFRASISLMSQVVVNPAITPIGGGGHCFVLARAGNRVLILDPKRTPLCKKLQSFLQAYLEGAEVLLASLI